MRGVVSALRDFLTNPVFLWIWIGLVAGSLVTLMWDLRENNPEVPSLMKGVWIATILYSGPVGLALYWYSGRKQIPRDTVWRRGVRSDAHCYSGCGAGEVAGIVIAAGILALGTWWVAAITFALAYVAGYAMTVGPLMQEGVGLREAMMDALYSETASITVMEVVAIGVDIYFAGDARMGEPLFWSALFFSLSMGLLAAYPVNVLLVRMGVKAGMMDPRDYGEEAGAH
ncbi:MAG: DUF4396 domain-containing protein [Gemmatimonadota bacterium]|nr:DUF4396 domain-containing protein [Gemmatimonadota bacterium]